MLYEVITDFYFNVTIPSLYSKSTGKPFSVNVHRNSGVVAVPMVDYYYKTGVKDKKGVMTINTTVFKNTGTYSGLASYPSMRFLLQTSNVLINYARITSYNVCYTKLLRARQQSRRLPIMISLVRNSWGLLRLILKQYLKPQLDGAGSRSRQPPELHRFANYSYNFV